MKFALLALLAFASTTARGSLVMMSSGQNSGDSCQVLEGSTGNIKGVNTGGLPAAQGTYSPATFEPGQSTSTVEVSITVPQACIGTYTCAPTSTAGVSDCTMTTNSCCQGGTCSADEFAYSLDLRCAKVYRVAHAFTLKAISSKLKSTDQCLTLTAGSGGIQGEGVTGAYTPVSFSAGDTQNLQVNVNANSVNCIGAYSCVRTVSTDSSSTCTMSTNTCCAASDNVCTQGEFDLSLDLRCADKYLVSDITVGSSAPASTTAGLLTIVFALVCLLR